MKRLSTRFALVVLLGGFVACVPDAGARMLQPVAKTAKQPAASAQQVETRIKTLHSQLRITPAQEPAFQSVAQVMRENESTLKPLREQKADAVESATAVDQLNSYAALVDAHAAGVHKFVPAFQTLYDSLSPDQKKAADKAFRERAREASKRGKL
ncbi:MAG TPA: Spy/CpxP family protein refolding chaperone [Candidatus Binatia bacterium]|jgi:hypothetical protein